jgi:hypothetical protein
VLVPVTLVAVTAGCGGSTSKRPQTTAVRRAAPLPPASTTTRTATTSPRTTTTTSGTAGASGVRLPATFVIHSGGRLTPSLIGAPTGVPVQLTVISGDFKAHRAAVAGHTLSVPAGGRSSLLLSGLGKGNYPLTVDGARRGTLVVGTQPGP